MHELQNRLADTEFQLLEGEKLRKIARHYFGNKSDHIFVQHYCNETMF